MEGMMCVNWPPRQMSHLRHAVPNYVLGQEVLIFSLPGQQRRRQFLCEIFGQMVLVPLSHLLFRPVNEWYSQNETRTSGQAKLANQEDGTFLVRPSESEQHSFRLMVKTRTAVHQILIHREEESGRFYLEPNVTFYSLNKMVDHYSTNSLPQYDEIRLRPYNGAPVLAEVLGRSIAPDGLSLQPGDVVTVLERFNNLWKVSHNNVEGYVSKYFLKVKRRVHFCERATVCDI